MICVQYIIGVTRDGGPPPKWSRSVQFTIFYNTIQLIQLYNFYHWALMLALRSLIQGHLRVYCTLLFQHYYSSYICLMSSLHGLKKCAERQVCYYGGTFGYKMYFADESVQNRSKEKMQTVYNFSLIIRQHCQHCSREQTMSVWLTSVWLLENVIQWP